MNIEVDKKTIKELDEIIIEHFVEVFADKCTDITAIAVGLQALIEKSKELKKLMEEENV